MRQRPANYYDAFDEAYRASWGMVLHHGWFDRERRRCRPADVLLRFEEEIVRRLQLDPLASIVLCDVGCGYGTLASSLVTRGLIDKVVAVTDSKSQVDHALRTLPRSKGFQIQHGSWLQNAFPADSFDRLIAIESLYHFPGDEKLSAIREVARVLRPSGRAVVTVWLKKDDGLGSWSR